MGLQRENLWIDNLLNKDRANTSKAVHDSIEHQLPGFFAFLDDIWGAGFLAQRRFAVVCPHPAIQIVVTQAFNDFNDLILDLDASRGRSAMRTTRSLIEHMVNLLEITNSWSSAERYLDHNAVTDVLEAESEFGLSHMSKREQQSERHRLSKLLRIARPKLRESLRQYGSGYARNWSGKSLQQMALIHGVQKHYHFYRFASHILHGSAGGSLGITKIIDNAEVYRVGPALQLLPIAFQEAAEVMQRLAQTMETSVTGYEASEFLLYLRMMTKAWRHYRKVIGEIDTDLWPNVAPSEPHAVLGISRNGTRQWFFFEPQLGALMKAEDPPAEALTSGQTANIEEIFMRGIHRDLPVEFQWLTIRVAGVMVTPVAHAKWFSAAGVLMVNSSTEEVSPAFKRQPSVSWLTT